MKGIQYLIDEQGKRTSVLINLEQWGELWEDFYEVMIAQERANEPEVDWTEVAYSTQYEEVAILETYFQNCLSLRKFILDDFGRSPPLSPD